MDDRQALIQAAKDTWGEVYLTFLHTEEVIFRPLTVDEYSKSLDVAMRESSADAEEYVIEIAVVWPETFNFDRYNIGEITALSDEILEQSGFSDYEVCVNKIDTAREKASEVVSFMIAMIIASEQGYDAHNLRHMTFSQIAEKAAMAERIFEIKQHLADGGEVKLEVRNPNPEAEEPRGPNVSDEEWAAIQRGEFKDPDKASTIGAAAVDDPIARKLQQALG